ncbi:DUF3782 domain-containing protein [Candidatus Magnetomoraceae bacterium gMMP-1]
MTDINLKELVASLAVSQKETDRQLKETDRQLKETDRQLKETDKQWKETDRMLTKSFQELSLSQKELTLSQKELSLSQKETDKQLKESDRVLTKKFEKVSEIVGNIGNNNGDVAEDFFFNGLSENPELGELKFDVIDRNVTRRTKRLEGEFDIVLTNSHTLVIIEVKYKLHPNDVDNVLNKKLPNFKKLFPQYKDFKMYGAVAAFSIPNESKHKAKEYGFFILTQSGNNIKILNDKARAYQQ